MKSILKFIVSILIISFQNTLLGQESHDLRIRMYCAMNLTDYYPDYCYYTNKDDTLKIAQKVNQYITISPKWVKKIDSLRIPNGRKTKKPIPVINFKKRYGSVAFKSINDKLVVLNNLHQ